MLERMVFSALYAAICAPIFYSLGVVRLTSAASGSRSR